MAALTAPLASLAITVVIGILASFAFNRYERQWFPTLIGAIGDRTSGLVGIAGAFIGLHIGAAIGLESWPAMLYIADIIGAFGVLWGWHLWM